MTAAEARSYPSGRSSPGPSERQASPRASVAPGSVSHFGSERSRMSWCLLVAVILYATGALALHRMNGARPARAEIQPEPKPVELLLSLESAIEPFPVSNDASGACAQTSGAASAPESSVRTRPRPEGPSRSALSAGSAVSLTPTRLPPSLAREGGSLSAAEREPGEPVSVEPSSEAVGGLDFTSFGVVRAVTAAGVSHGGPGEPDGSSRRGEDGAGRGVGGGARAAGSAGAGRGDVVGGSADYSTPVGLPSSNWRCPWPASAASAELTQPTVLLEVGVTASGQVSTARLLADPGFGFGEAALSCARRARFQPARDARGRAVAALSPPVRVRFVR